MEARRDVFQAIADPTRRAIIGMVARQPANVNAIAAHFSHMSRQAISLHLRILNECGLLTFHHQGRERICQIRPEPLDEVQSWINQHQQFWSQKLDALSAYLDIPPQPNKNKQHGH